MQIGLKINANMYKIERIIELRGIIENVRVFSMCSFSMELPVSFA